MLIEGFIDSMKNKRSKVRKGGRRAGFVMYGGPPRGQHQMKTAKVGALAVVMLGSFPGWKDAYTRSA